MRKARAIADRENVGIAGAQASVDCDAVVDRGPPRRRAISPAPRRRRRRSRRPRAGVRRRSITISFALAREARDAGGREISTPSRACRSASDGGNLGGVARCSTRGAASHDDVAAERARARREFQPDEAAADDRDARAGREALAQGQRVLVSAEQQPQFGAGQRQRRGRAPVASTSLS